MKKIVWTEYFKYRVKLWGFSLANIEDIITLSTERYLDVITGRLVVVGKDADLLVMIPYEETEVDIITPVTVHATSRQQINNRIKSGRLLYE